MSAIYDRFVGGQMSNEEMARFLAEDIWKRRVGPAEAELLVRLVEHPGLTPDSTVGAERWSLAIMGDRLRNGEVTPQARPVLEDAIERALASPVWRLRRVAMAVAIEADLHVKRPSVNARIRSMTTDPVPEVSEIAKLHIRRHLDPPGPGSSTGGQP
ncbi:hypothetical protein J4558_19510 [Leptolyngbya sp. 15MV]|nr:hypothetical protein J4558_19510 [Leptolyngbya sp. 15MV]